MRVLVVAPQPFFSPRGTPLSVYYRTLISAELGVEVDLLTYGQGQDVVIPGVRIIRIPPFNFLGRVKVGPSYLKLWFDVLLFVRMAHLVMSRRYDAVHAHEEAVFLYLPLRRLVGCKLIYDMHSSLPAQLTNFKFSRSTAVIRVFEWLEDKALQSADIVVTICEDLYLYATGKIEDQSKVFLIENSIFDAISLVRNGTTAPADPALAAVGKPLILYAGTLEPYQGIDLALDAFQNVVQRITDVHFLIAGGTEQQVRHYQRKAAALGIADRCQFVGTVPKAQAQDYVQGADLLISPRISGTNTPLKVYEQLASGIPIVATNIYAHRQVLTDDVAFLVEPDAESMAEGILRALQNPEEGKLKSGRARELYQQKYSRGTYVEKMNQVLEAVR